MPRIVSHGSRGFYGSLAVVNRGNGKGWLGPDCVPYAPSGTWDFSEWLGPVSRALRRRGNLSSVLGACAHNGQMSDVST